MFIKQISFWKLVVWLFFTIYSDTKPHDTKKEGKWQPKINKMIRGMIKLVTHHSYSEKKPTING